MNENDNLMYFNFISHHHKLINNQRILKNKELIECLFKKIKIN